MTAVLGVRLTQSIVEVLELSLKEAFFYSDSVMVGSRQRKRFPSVCGTPNELSESIVWWTGPEWLHDERSK